MQSVYTVAQVNSYIKNMFTQDYLLQAVSVKGEISNCKYHSSGHIYFTLKDKLSVISCVMFAGNRKGLSFNLQEGMQVVVSGRVDTYERDGKYQLYATHIKKDGFGELYERFLQLKQELEERGLFAAEYKQPIPKYVKTIGVVTAATGAAIRDIISVSKGRNPFVQIVLYPAQVQGIGAAHSVAEGIRALEQFGVDVIIVGRGGGSLEDLWAFNEEEVAQAIFDCKVPTISAVGHETDVTIADYVADRRAETPTAAAQMATFDVATYIHDISLLQDRLSALMEHKVDLAKMSVRNASMLLMNRSPKSMIADRRYATMQAEERLSHAMADSLTRSKNKLALLAGSLNGVSPLEKLSQGYSYTENADGKGISDVTNVAIEDIIKVHVKNGAITAKVKDVVKIERQ
ncbi:MAG: exodeoxyribonuclease VII large subunit [Lachnospiraceae bacterium]|nr:exodeoxyribonuclease VII large subunit [Candidatus Colinaster equi]